MNDPLVEATPVYLRKQNTWLLTLTCPFCHKKHTHGGGHGPNPPPIGMYGDRLSHCLKNEKHYTLVPLKESPA
jgi:hypothetical protein